MKKWFYIAPLVLCLMIGFVMGHFINRTRANRARTILYYKDPMHPSYRAGQPGIAPDCGMELVPVYADETAQSLAADGHAASSGVEIEPSVQQLYGIKLVSVVKDSGQNHIRLYARVEADETRVYRVNFGTDGFVRETHGDALGTHVTKDQHLATVYSPEFLSVAGGYLAANERAPGASNTAKDNYNGSTAAQGAASVLARADRLRNLGMSDSQIEEISQSHKLPEDVYIVSPADGFILSRNISPGMRFERQVDLYRVADLSRVWIVAEASGHDAQALRPGMIARIVVPDSQVSLSASVSTIMPEVDPVTHSVKIRLEANNPSLALRPGMFVSVEAPISLPRGLSVPADAVIDSGSEKKVFVQSSENRFEPRSIETGWQSGDRIQILKGLHEGESVVSAGAFLIDSESRMHSSTGAATARAPHQK